MRITASLKSDRRILKEYLVLSGIASLVLFLILTYFNSPLKSEAAPFGIISFELAFNRALSDDIVQSWTNVEQMYAAFSLGLDYLFLFAYALFLSSLSWLIASKLAAQKIMIKFGMVSVYAVWIAAGLDTIENFALFQILFGNTSGFWPPMAATCASIKFLLVILAFIYIFIGSVLLRLPAIKTSV